MAPIAAGGRLVPMSFESGGRRISFAPMICFDAIFPEVARTFVLQDADFLVNPTNDAWYGYSSGPYQFLAIVRMRAIETGRSVARPAYSGRERHRLPDRRGRPRRPRGRAGGPGARPRPGRAAAPARGGAPHPAGAARPTRDSVISSRGLAGSRRPSCWARRCSADPPAAPPRRTDRHAVTDRSTPRRDRFPPGGAPGVALTSSESDPVPRRSPASPRTRASGARTRRRRGC